VIFASRGVNQHANGTQTNRVLMFPAAITGNWGRRGGAYFNMSHGTPITPNAPADRRAKVAKPRVRRSPSGWTEAMTRGRPYPIRALIACNNPMSQWPGQAAASGIEKGEIGRANDDRRIVWIDRMIDPPGEAKADGWIWVELGKRLGFSDVLKEAYKDPAVFWDEVCIQNDLLRGVTQKRLHSVPHRWVRQPVASETAPEMAVQGPRHGRSELHCVDWWRRRESNPLDAYPWMTLPSESENKGTLRDPQLPSVLPQICPKF